MNRLTSLSYACLMFLFFQSGCEIPKEQPINAAVDSLDYEIINLDQRFGDCEDERSNCATINISYPYFFSDEADSIAISINKFIMDYLLYYSFGEDKVDNLNSLIQQYIDNYKDFLSQYPDYSIGWKEQKDVSILLNKHGVLSLKLFDFGFMGGAHPNTAIAFENFNLQSGKPIKLSDLFKKGYRNSLTRLAEREFQSVRGLEKGADYDSLGFRFENNQFSLTDNFAMTDTALIFLYNSYEIAPYAFGQTEIRLAYNNLRQMILIDGPLNKIATKE
ncbi:DUF3298 domain-containing protein [Bacteroidota bacterium]